MSFLRKAYRRTCGVSDEQVFKLFLCSNCGQTEQRLSGGVAGYKPAFLDKGTPPADFVGDWHFKQTTSTCPTCLALITADLVIRNNRVYFRKDCLKCGPSEALVSEDAEYYVRAYSYARAGTQPLAYVQEAKLGCPTDCGHCGDHEQHTCLPIIEVTDHCDLECPNCIVDNNYSTHIDPIRTTSMATQKTC